MKITKPLLLASLIAMSGHTLAADAAAGKDTYVSNGCAGCHGVEGVAVAPTFPTLKGRDSAFVKENLGNFRNGSRVGTTMNAMAAGLSNEAIDNLAAYISSF